MAQTLDAALDNGTVKVGVSRNYGGAIVWLSASSGNNLINNADKGRQIQQSYYAGHSITGTNQCPSWSPWPWNPIMVGDCGGNTSPVLTLSNSNGQIYVKTQPMLWDRNNSPAQAYLEHWISFHPSWSNVVIVTNTLTCFRDANDAWGDTATLNQELPACYFVSCLNRIMSYTGSLPWKNQPLATIPNAWPWTNYIPAESWSACVDGSDFGAGVYSPIATACSAGMAGSSTTCNTFDGSTMYIGPLGQYALSRNTVFSYRYYLMVGTLSTIRSMVYELHPTAPGITTPPQSQTAPQGTSPTFSVTAFGSSPLSYQWRFNGTNLTNTATSTLTLTNVQVAQAGTYTVQVTNTYGSFFSSNAVLTVVNPGIVSQPQNQFVAAGAPATFSVIAGGALPLSYQWLKEAIALADGNNISGAQTATLTVAQVQAGDVGSYRCVVTNSDGSVTSSPATLTVIANTYAAGSVSNIPTLAGDTTNDARAITPDGLWVVGVSGTRGFLYDVSGANVYNAFNGAQQLTPVAGVCYRTENGQKEIVVGGLAAGWDSSLMTTNGTGFSSVDRYSYGGSGQKPVQGLTNLRAAGGGDVFFDAWWDVQSQGKVFVGKFSGAWPASLTPTPGTWDTSSVGIGASVSVNAVSGTGRAVGSLGSAIRVFDWTGTGAATASSFNGLNGTTAGAAFAISSDGTVIFGQSPVSGGRAGSWPYKAVVTSASPGVWQSITELPGFTNTVGTSGSAGVPYGCTADGMYAVGMSYRGIEKAVLWNVSATNPTNWAVVDLTDLAVAGGKLNIFTRLARAYSVGTNSAGNLVIAGMGWDTNSPARPRAFIMTVIPSSAPAASRPTVTLLGSYPGGFTFSFPTVANATLTYCLEYTTNLAGAITWTTIGSTPGTGGVATLSDPNPSDQQRFYRIRVQ